MAVDYSGSLVVVVGAPSTTCFPKTTCIRIENLKPTNPADRLARWHQKCHSAHAPITALDAYTGEAWNHLKTGFAANPVADKSLWIASPGIGLRRATQTIPNYSASFYPDHPDCVGNSESARQFWWDALNHNNHSTQGSPLGISGLVSRYPESTFFIVLQGEFLPALQADLWEAHTAHPLPDRFLVLSSGQSSCHGIGTSFIRLDTEFEKTNHGPRHTILPRTARYILENFTLGELSATYLRSRLQQLKWKLPDPVNKDAPAKLPKIQTLDLEKFVIQSLTQNPNLKPNGLLRLLRSTGHTCDPKLLAHFYLRHALPLLPPTAPTPTRRKKPAPE